MKWTWFVLWAGCATAPRPVDDVARPDMVTIPGGSFVRACAPNETAPCHGEVEAFAIDRLEVRLGDYLACVEAGACAPIIHRSSTCDHIYAMLAGRRPDAADVAASCMPPSAMASYCGWVGKRLPSALEWQRALRGDDARRYPWGDDARTCDDVAFCPGIGPNAPWPVGAKAGDVSPYGVRDLAGNVREWTSGGWLGGDWHGWSGLRDGAVLDKNPAVYGSFGFRCAR